jgi:hypothetical protein
MRNQRDLVKASFERTYPRDVYPRRVVVDTRTPGRPAPGVVIGASQRRARTGVNR